MIDSNRNVVVMLWIVVAVLVLGGGAIGYLLLNKTDQLTQTNDELNGNVSSLREQLRQAKLSPSPSVTPSPTTSPTTTPSITPSPTASPHSSH